ncbi:MAG: hypothetical protein BRD53_04190, partial [Bacteroidetes bacterium SW_7_64_58]
SRADRLRRRRRAKAQEDHISDRGFLETVDRYIVDTAVSVIPNQIALKVPELDVAGIQPIFGTTTGGATAGLLYEPTFFRANEQPLRIEAVGGLSRYYRTETLFRMERGRYVGYAFARYEHQPRGKFFGVGSGSVASDQSTFRLDEGLLGILGGRSLGYKVLVGGHFTYQLNRVGNGSGDGPQVREQFGDEVPGVGENVDHLMIGGFFEYDSRDASAQRTLGHRFAPTENRLRSVSLEASRGFYLSAEVTRNVDTRAEQYGFTRYTLDAREFLPVDKELLHGFAFRQFASFTQSGKGEVPFYRLQSIGGSRSLRGYQGGRFRDRNVILSNAEVRCQVWHGARGVWGWVSVSEGRKNARPNRFCAQRRGNDGHPRPRLALLSKSRCGASVVQMWRHGSHETMRIGCSSTGPRGTGACSARHCPAVPARRSVVDGSRSHGHALSGAATG